MLSESEARRIYATAAQDSARVPLAVLRQVVRGDGVWQQLLAAPDYQREAVAHDKKLAALGISADDIARWAGILQIENADERVAAFVADPAPKPIFVLVQLLRRGCVFQRGASLAALLRYVQTHHVEPRRAYVPAKHRTLDGATNMDAQTFVMVTRLLVAQYVRLWPSALPAVAALAADYIETIPAMAQAREQQKEQRELKAQREQNEQNEDGEPPEGATDKVDPPRHRNTPLEEMTPMERRVYRDMCTVFNATLVLLRQRAPAHPVASMRHHWRAQKVLLGISAAPSLPRPLLLSRDAFRAIRRVLVALQKSPRERHVAVRSARAWPPYRHDWDGRDEARRPRDDWSRSVEAGATMHAAGFADADTDRALDVLGGSVPGAGPTVQTRSLGPHVWTGARAALNQYSLWAARVRATRDVNEAWHQFQTVPGPAAPRPNFQVYLEMFRKLLADAQAEPHETQNDDQPHARPILPGDARETLPVYDLGLTAVERARRAPPSPGQLYRRMIFHGVRPVGPLLVTLLDGAENLSQALLFLHDSGLRPAIIDALRLPATFVPAPLMPHSPVYPESATFGSDDNAIVRTLPVPPPDLRALLAPLPLPVFSAYVRFLLRKQPFLTRRAASDMKLFNTRNLHHALRLTLARLPPHRVVSRSYLHPWEQIALKLGQPRVLLGPVHSDVEARHDREALRLALLLGRHVQRVTQGARSVHLFFGLAKCTLKHLRWRHVYMVPRGDSHRDQDQDGDGDLCTFYEMQTPLLREAHAFLRTEFEAMLADGACAHDHPAHDNSVHPANAVHPLHPATRIELPAYVLCEYVKVLAYLRDAAGMARALAWVVRVYDDPVALADAKDHEHPAHSAVQRALVLYRVTAEASPDPADHEQLRQLEHDFGQLHARGGWWWPAAADCDNMVRWYRDHEHFGAWWRWIRRVD